MLIVFSVLLLFFTIFTGFLAISTTSFSSALHPDELNALEKIATTLGIKGLNLSNGDPCSLGTLKMRQDVDGASNPENRNSTIRCDCSFNNSRICHITSIDLKTLSLPGKLPPELAELRYLRSIDLCRNYLSGTIPMEWASLPYLTSISLCANNLSGPLPTGLQNFKNLTVLALEANQFSGPIPDELGNLTSLTRLHLTSNQFTGSLPNTLARLVNLTDFEDDTYIISTSLTLPGDSPDLYKTARRSALSLVYYAFCLENGPYNVKLHFMEIQFSDKQPYSGLGRRMFDVYVQGKLFLRNFNIREEAKGSLTPVVKELKAVNVTDHLLEIQLYWAGKGTTLIPKRGNYGPLISAISLCHNSMEPQCGAEKIKGRINYPLILGAVGALVTVILLALGVYAQRRCTRDKNTRELELRAKGLPTVCFTWKQLQAATNYFDQSNKLGEGGFGSVFKGELSDGTIIAVKQLSSKSCQGNREFVNEIGMISGLNHPNLVKLYGCCVEKDQLLLVYEYMENNSLALMLHGKSSLNLDWEARQKICVGIARGLEFLHEGSMIRMVHRDIKTTNVLLDADLNAKISDFGLARLHGEEEEHTHISTKISGTIGYMAPEYALWGQLSEKADVYSFGVVAMEIASGKSNTKHKGSADHVSLINWALTLQQAGEITEMVDPALEGNFNSKEAVRMIKVALACTISSPSLRPTMSEVVQMLSGEIEITEVLSDPGLYGHNWSLSKLRDVVDTDGSLSTSVFTDQTATNTESSVSGYDLYPLRSESMILNSTIEFSSSSR
ncbi:putative LRR receptor-like serine/threonine-protein kinase [Raphanus sativus]|nr:putative LRR receptor-like serine/threonine-protein kinase [Raphanus sativus]